MTSCPQLNLFLFPASSLDCCLGMHCENKYLILQKLPHYFSFMGGTFNGSLNQSVDRNDEAVSGGSDTYSHRLQI